jgi:predicted amidohydrolase YtcJ
MASSGIGANFNPEIKHLIADAQVHSIGPERAAYEWPYHTALAAGVSVASSSDAPVTPGNWLQGLATMVERKGKQSGMVSGPEERISLDAAIRTYTWAGAWQDHAEHVKGSLEPGKLADLCVLDERISATPPERWAGTSVFMTVVDGRVAYQAGVA